jgi:hypothetical protein
MTAILRYLGLIETEYHHIVGGFNKAVDDLKALAVRKKAEAKSLGVEIAQKTTEQSLAASAASQADATASKIAALVS